MGRVKDLLPTEPEPGAACPIEDCTGHLGDQELPGENCSCHISPPCGACLEAPYKCDTCGEEFFQGDS